MSTENKELARRFFEAFSRHDTDALGELASDDFVHHHSTNQGRAGLRAEAEYWYNAFPDASVAIEDLIAETDRVVVRLSATGTHLGEFFGLEPTDRTISVEEIHILRVENGMVAEIWAAPDIYGLLSQLGALPEMLPEEDM